MKHGAAYFFSHHLLFKPVIFHPPGALVIQVSDFIKGLNMPLTSVRMAVYNIFGLHLKSIKSW